MKKTSNIQHRTLNPGSRNTSTFGVRCSGFDVFGEEMDTSWRNTIWRIVEFIIGGIFIYAGVVKVMEPIRFAEDIDNYHLVPWMVSVRLAFYLPWLEILCGIALIVRRLYGGALTIFLALIVVFIGANVVAKMRGLDVKCGCFGHVSDHLGFASHMALNLAILAGIALLLRRTKAVS